MALPDSRFHLNFAEVIPDFAGSRRATDRLVGAALLRGRAATPSSRRTTAWSICAGACSPPASPWSSRPTASIAASCCSSPAWCRRGQELFAAWLDGLEHFGRPITLAEIAARGRFDFMVTGASAVSLDGVRFGKGHGFFDLEWGMFTDLGIVDEAHAGRGRRARRAGGRGQAASRARPTSSSTTSRRRRAASGSSAAAAAARRQMGAADAGADRRDAAAPGAAADPWDAPAETGASSRDRPSTRENRHACHSALTPPQVPGRAPPAAVGACRGAAARARAAHALHFQASWVNDAEFTGYFVADRPGLLRGRGPRPDLPVRAAPT